MDAREERATRADAPNRDRTDDMGNATGVVPARAGYAVGIDVHSGVPPADAKHSGVRYSIPELVEAGHADGYIVRQPPTPAPLFGTTPGSAVGTPARSPPKQAPPGIPDTGSTGADVVLPDHIAAAPFKASPPPALPPKGPPAGLAPPSQPAVTPVSVDTTDDELEGDLADDAALRRHDAPLGSQSNPVQTASGDGNQNTPRRLDRDAEFHRTAGPAALTKENIRGTRTEGMTDAEEDHLFALAKRKLCGMIQKYYPSRGGSGSTTSPVAKRDQLARDKTTGALVANLTPEEEAERLAAFAEQFPPIAPQWGRSETWPARVASATSSGTPTGPHG